MFRRKNKDASQGRKKIVAREECKGKKGQRRAGGSTMKKTKTVIYTVSYTTFQGCGVYGSNEMELTTTGKKGLVRRNKRPQKLPKSAPESSKKWTMQRENE